MFVYLVICLQQKPFIHCFFSPNYDTFKYLYKFAVLLISYSFLLLYFFFFVSLLPVKSTINFDRLP